MKVSYDFNKLGVSESNRDEYLVLLNQEIEYFVNSKFVANDRVSVQIEYDVKGLLCYDDLIETEVIYKLQAIKSIIELVQKTNKFYAINLDADNLYFKSDGSGLQLERALDVSRQEEAIYTNQIKGLIGNLLTNNSIEAIASSNGELLKNDKYLKSIADVEDLTALNQAFAKIISKVQAFEQEKLVKVNKNFAKKTKQISRIKTLLILILCIITIFLAVVYIPNRTSQLDAIGSYEDKVYEDVLTSLEKTNINAMSPVIKYVEAESTVRLSQLSDSQKDNILYNLTPTVEEGILDFWVYIGQNNLDAAYEQSIQNNDAQQKAYVLLLLIDQTQNDPDLKTEEKDSLLSTYQGELDSITASMEDGDE